MKTFNHSASAYARAALPANPRRRAARLLPLIIFALFLPASIFAQKLPSPEKVVGNYVKAIGGKKRVAALTDARYEWTVMLKEQAIGRAVTEVKAPASARLDLIFQNGEIQEGANSSSAWMRGLDGKLRTLTDAEAHTAKLLALLDASHLVDYKKQNVLARTLNLDQSGTEPAYVVEFAMRNGARLRYWLGARSYLLLKIRDEARAITLRFSDYRAEGDVLQPHRVERELGMTGALTLTLNSVRYNIGIASSRFDPPVSETLDINALLKELDKNQEQIDERVGDYTFLEKSTERQINGKGEMTKETIRVYEVYPVPGERFVRKLISENGVALTGERAAKEQKRVGEELEKAERERVKAAEKRARDREKNKKETDDPGISDFLRTAELVSPRRERLRDRETIVFDFRPRAGYKPKNDMESIAQKLTGIIWIDPVEKQVVRLEARLTDSYKVGGGLLASIRPGTAFTFEQQRMEDGVWLPVFTQVNVSAKIMIFKGMEINITQEFSNYKRFKSNVEDYKLSDKPEPKKP
ncbi:MAG: hypothetical protein ICV60_06770 [Pyrinomonadaceae bacterium]|nr:hypothetical protein [Pyrinomonadaceae bacterium]